MLAKLVFPADTDVDATVTHSMCVSRCKQLPMIKLDVKTMLIVALEFLIKLSQ